MHGCSHDLNSERKTLTFALVHFSVAFIAGYLVTGSLMLGGLLALIEPAVNTVAYYLHERLWARWTAHAGPQVITG